MNFIDLFAGIGGFRVALESCGLDCVYSSEWDKFARITYEHNFNDLPDGDITKINLKKIPTHDCLCAGFPCQPFSISGNHGGFKDTRGTLFFNIATIVKLKKPKIIFLENVRNILSHDQGRTMAIIKKTLHELGYDVFYKLFNSSHFGVPQNRQRVYIICFEKKLKINEFEFPEPTFKEIYLENIIEKGVVAKSYEINRSDIFLNKKITNNDLKKQLKPIRIGTISKGGQGERIYSPKGHAITISAYGGGIAAKTGAYLIDDTIRQLTVRECLRLQGYPEEFSFPEKVTTSQAYKMCGNSVTVPVISKIYEKIRSYL